MLNRAEIRRKLDSLLPKAASQGREMEYYLRYHYRRFEYLAQLVDRLLDDPAKDGQTGRLLDVGPSFQTDLFHLAWPELNIDTLGFFDPKWPKPPTGEHVTFDLNDADDRSRWPQNNGYQVVVAAEVIEHLYTSPRQTLACLASLVRPGGYLVIQTPNAVALRSRLLMLLGRNPFEMIREERTNPGHYREYTGSELQMLGRDLGLEVRQIQFANYSSSGSLGSRVFGWISPVLPPTLRKCVTIVYRQPDH